MSEWEDFRNEITWQRSDSHDSASRYGNVADIILYYTVSDSFCWNRQYLPYSEAQTSRSQHGDSTGHLYKLENLTASRPDSDSGKFEWRGTMPPPSRGWAYRLEHLEAWWAEGRIQTKRDSTPRMDGRKVHLDECDGKPSVNIWTGISRIPNTSTGRTGFPTQKPVALYERMIKASSNAGDKVLDPFCRCATTCVATDRPERQWVGIDIRDDEESTLLARMKNEGVIADGSIEASDQSLLFPKDIAFTKEFPERTDNKQPAVPSLEVTIKVEEPQNQKMARQQMYEVLLSHNGIKCQRCYRSFGDPRNLQLDQSYPSVGRRN